MDLILWRHAEAEDIHDGIADHERNLTAKGKRQAQKMADWLSPQLPRETRILVSPAARTVQTAEALKRKFEISEKLFTDSTFNDHLTAAQWPDGDTVLLVGHQPTLGKLAALLMTGRPQEWDIKKGAIWWLRSATDKSNRHAALRVAMMPGMLD